MSYRLSLNGQAIDNTLVNSAVACTSVASANDVSIVFSNPESGATFSAIIQAATTSQAGVIDADTYRKIQTAYTLISELPAVPDSASVSTSADAVYMYMRSGGRNLFSATLSAATTERAGLMTAASVRNLAAASRMFSARVVEGVQRTTTIPLAGSGGVLCIDIADNALLLYLNSKYYEVWTEQRDANGLSSYDYRVAQAFFNANGVLFMMNNGTPVKVGGNFPEDVEFAAIVKSLPWYGEVTIADVSMDVSSGNFTFGIAQNAANGRICVVCKANGQENYYNSWYGAPAGYDVISANEQGRIYICNSKLYQGTGNLLVGLSLLGGQTFAPVLMSHDDYMALSDEQKAAFDYVETY